MMADVVDSVLTDRAGIMKKHRSKPLRSPAKTPAPRRKTSGSRARGAKSFPVVGVGASAGGYEAFSKFLEQLPVDIGMAVVLVQHMDPTHESKLTELLSRSTRLPVIEVTSPIKVEPNHVYVIPPNKKLVIAGGRLKLSPRQMAELPPMPVDFFLRSLAEDQGHNAIGIIFSGNGSDGTLGMEAINRARTASLSRKTRKAPVIPACPQAPSPRAAWISISRHPSGWRANWQQAGPPILQSPRHQAKQAG